MQGLGEYLLTLLSQFAGGPGPPENNLVRFGLAAILWFVLLAVAWSRQRSGHLPREKLLLLGFGLGFVRELFMITQVSGRLLVGKELGVGSEIHQPLEHAFTMTAIVAVAGAFLLYALDDQRLSRRYLEFGGGATAIALIIALVFWPRQVAANPLIRFHETWVAWIFHISLALLIVAAGYHLSKKPGWLTNVVILALSFFLLGEILILFNYGSDKAFSRVVCPIANSFHILAIPVLGFVYLREQSIEKRQAEDALAVYREHLEELVEDRTAALEAANTQLVEEIREREQTEHTLEQLSRRYELILASAGEGICGLDQQGRFIFVNPAAADMLGYEVAELVGKSSHEIWLPRNSDGIPYQVANSPIYAAYSYGVVRHGDDHVFWRKDGTCFPVRFIANPARTPRGIAGTVVVFRDITERKQAEVEIARRSARLATQNAVAFTLSQSLDLNAILDDALDIVLSLQDLELGAILLRDPESGGVAVQAVRGCISKEEMLRTFEQHAHLIDVFAAAIETAEPVARILSASDYADPPECITREQLQTIISIPLITRGRVVGTLAVGSRRLDSEQQPVIEQLTAIGQQIAMAIENARLYQATERSRMGLSMLHRISGQLSATLDPGAVNAAIAEQSTRLLGCSAAAVLRCGARQKQCEVVASHGLLAAEKIVLQSAYPRNLVQEFAVSQQPVASSDALTDLRIPRSWRREFRTHSLLCLPLWHDTSTTKFLLLIERESRAWKPEEINLIERFGHRATIAQTNAKLHEQAEMTAALEERQRIAANMHDGLAQVLSYMNLKTDLALDLLENHNVEPALDELRMVQSAIDRASVDVRRSITSLQSGPQPRRSLQQALAHTASESAIETGPPVEIVDLLPEPVTLSAAETEQVIRVVQEAILNACRHAHARQITVTAGLRKDEFEIVIADDGQGFCPELGSASSGHFGLSIMQARASRIDGALEIDSQIGAGTRVTLTWPIRDRIDRTEEVVEPVPHDEIAWIAA